jgi:AraC-like DNA-binding protein
MTLDRPISKHEILIMGDVVPSARIDECLRLGCAPVFEVVQADHFSTEQAGVTSVRVSGEACLFFSDHGGVVVQDGRADVVVRANEAFLYSAGPGELRLSRSAGAELYVLRFRQARQKNDATGLRLEVPDHVTVRRPGRLTHLLRRLVDERRRSAPSRAVQHHLVVLSLCELSRSSQVDSAGGVREAVRESIASRVDAYVAAHYHEPISTPAIAAELHYNPDYLERAFRLERQMSIRDAVHARRIKEARAQLLLLRTQGVAEIAALCGYTDPGYFRRVFKRATNLTPRSYRLVHAG